MYVTYPHDDENQPDTLLLAYPRKISQLAENEESEVQGDTFKDERVFETESPMQYFGRVK